ncbi:MAG: hypothetical protein LBC84_09820 [Prevotellaceae bacterium]|jgi:16S rRNA processing protein RimM|nr:hypothetical protein [Prevotellaceae bacterium]
MIEAGQLQPIADILNLYGNNGTLVVKFRPKTRHLFLDSEPVFAILEGIPVPFFIATFTVKGNDRAHILFDYVYRESQMLELIGKTLYQPHKKEKNRGQTKDPGMLIGFTVTDVKLGLLGSVNAFMDWSLNPCLDIIQKDNAKSFLVPFQEAFIKDIDLNAKRIILSLPDGLMEVNE